jgi:hypothetical protein
MLGAEDIQQLALVYKDRHLDNNNLVFLGALIAASSQSSDPPGLDKAVILGIATNGASEQPHIGYSANHMLSPDVIMSQQGLLTKDLLVSRPNKDSIPISISICLEKPSHECVTLRPEISHDIYRLRQYDQTH